MANGRDMGALSPHVHSTDLKIRVTSIVLADFLQCVRIFSKAMTIIIACGNPGGSIPWLVRETTNRLCHFTDN